METLPHEDGNDEIHTNKKEEHPLVEHHHEHRKEKTPNKANTYAAKKSVAQRMMDIALLTSNANQLRYVLRYNSSSPSFAVAVTLIILSLGLQVAVGIYLIFGTRKDSTPEEKERSNNIVIAGVFLITIVNVLVSAFSVEGEGGTSSHTPTSSLELRLGNLSEYDN